MNEQEKEKASKKKKDKQERPRGYRSRKAGVVGFWISIMALIFFVAINLNDGNNSSKAAGNEPVAVEKSMSTEAMEFSKEFLAEHFTWSLEKLDEEARAQRLSYYTTKDLAKNLAAVKEENWNSSLVRNNIVLKDSEYLGDNRSRLTFQTNLIFKKTESALNKEVEELKIANMPADGESNGSTEKFDAATVNPDDFGVGTVDVAVNEQGIVTQMNKKKYVIVNLYYDDTTERFVIYQEPQFTNLELSENTVIWNSETAELTELTANRPEEIESFVKTFFESFASDPKEKLSYFIEDTKYQNGLNESMKFVDAKELRVFEGANENEWVTDATVIFADPDTNTEFSSYYTLVLEKKDGRFVVTHINDSNYLQFLAGEKAETEDMEKE